MTDMILRLRSLRRLLLVIVVAVFTTGAPSSTCAAQEEDAAGAWALLGIDWVRVGDEGGAGLQGELGYQTGRIHFGARFLSITEVDLIDWNGPEKSRELFEVGPVVGVAYGWRLLVIQANIGVSLIRGSLVEELAEDHQNAFGIPLEIGLSVAVNRRMGIGMGAYQNLTVNPFGGLVTFLTITK